MICGLMWDSTTPGVIPGFALLRAMYINGRYAVTPSYHKGHIYIDVLGNAPDKASVLDVETGDAPASFVDRWLAKRFSVAGTPGTIYCNRSTLPAVQAAASRRPFSVWLATLDGTIPEEISGGGTLVAVQAYPASMTGVNADISVVVNQDWWTEHAA